MRTYKRVSDRQSWTECDMQQAVLSVINGDHGYKKASEMYSVPQTTLERRVAKFRKNPDINDACKKTLGVFKTVFNHEEEAELVQYVQQMEKMLFGLTSYEFRKLAYELAERNKKAHKFNKELGVAGYDWYQGFMSRHAKHLSLRKPEATSAARAMGFNRVAVNAFFSLLENVIDTHKIDQQRIWNVDETGISTVPKSLSKVISTKGARQVGSLTSAERGQLVTAVLCCSSSGRFMPPMLIFPRQRMKAELMDGAPLGAWAMCHPSGWIQTDLFISWLKAFIKFTGATKDSQVLLILDGHATHTKSIELIDIAKENGVILLCLPPHCTHRMQPLDVSFMKPLSTFYDNNQRRWLRSNPGRVVTQFQIASLFGTSYLDAATMNNAINGFRKTGIWQVDRTVFTDADFMAAEVTDITDMDIATADTVSLTDGSVVVSAPANIAILTPAATIVSAPANVSAPVASDILTPATAVFKASTSQYKPIAGVASNFAVSPKQLLPIPKQVERKRISKQRGKTAVLTSSPYKKSLRLEKKNSTSTSSQKPKKIKLVAQKSSNEDTPCLYCEEMYSNSRESWVSCIECHRWAHYACAGLEERNKNPNFICELCINSD